MTIDFCMCSKAEESQFKLVCRMDGIRKWREM